MSSTDAEPSESFPGIDKTVDHSDGNNQAMDFTHARTIVGDTVTNGDKSAEQKQNEGGNSTNNDHDGDSSLHATSEASSGHKYGGPASDNFGEASKDGAEGHKIELKDAPSENASEAVESEKHDSVAASAGSSPPPSSAAPDELHMDTDTKSNSEEGDSKESNEIKKDSEKEADAIDVDDAGDKMDTNEEGEVEVEKEEQKEDEEVSEKSDDKAADDADKKEEGGAKRVLPKWMVQDADAPPSPKEETDEKDVAAPVTENAPASGARGRGRGRRGRDSTRAVAKPHNEDTAEQPQPESLASGRPRRSTRSNVDYAHPDVATVVAEQEDLENELQQKVSRSRGRGRGRGRGGRAGGRKRAAADSDDGEDSDSEYGSHKKQKRTGGGGARGRGRGRGRGRPARAKKSRKEESDDEDEEMDLTDNDVNGSPGSGEEAYKPAPSKRRAAAAATAVAEAHSPKTSPKKRGRIAATKAH